MLAHNVYFSLKEPTEANKEALTTACRKYLVSEPGTLFFACGTRQKDLDRPVNDLDFDVSLHLVFVSKAAHDAYQDAPLHHEFVNENKQNWAKVRVFDSNVEGHSLKK
jgi:Stress responsive A/B Barrel Domain